MTVGATSSTPGKALMMSPNDSCITARENAKNMEEFGGCTRMSAPTPSTRLPHSETTPEVRPAIISTKISWMAMAVTLKELRRGRAVMLPQNICSKENGPSNVSFITADRRGTLPYCLSLGSKHEVQLLLCSCTSRAECSRKYFAPIKFSTQVLISLWKNGSRACLTSPASMMSPTLHHFRAAASQERSTEFLGVNYSVRNKIFETRRALILNLFTCCLARS